MPLKQGQTFNQKPHYEAEDACAECVREETIADRVRRIDERTDLMLQMLAERLAEIDAKLFGIQQQISS